MHCKNPKFKGEHWQVGDQKTATTKRFVGCADSPTGLEEIKVHYEILTGWWEYQDGTEGGDLELWLNDSGNWEVNDFDGAFDLPKFIKEELRAQNIEVNF